MPAVGQRIEYGCGFASGCGAHIQHKARSHIAGVASQHAFIYQGGCILDIEHSGMQQRIERELRTRGEIKTAVTPFHRTQGGISEEFADAIGIQGAFVFAPVNFDADRWRGIERRNQRLGIDVGQAAQHCLESFGYGGFHLFVL